MNPYKDNGYKNRQDYLECLADDSGLPIDALPFIPEQLDLMEA